MAGKLPKATLRKLLEQSHARIVSALGNLAALEAKAAELEEALELAREDLAAAQRDAVRVQAKVDGEAKG